MKITESRLKEIIKEEMQALAVSSQASTMEEEAPPDMFGEPDEEGGMARGELFKISKYGQEIRNMLEDDDQLPAWVQSKITKCAAMMGDVKHFLEGEMANQSDEMAPQEPSDLDDEEIDIDDDDLEADEEGSLDEMIAEQLKAVLEKKVKKK
jgi:hypothetical protein